MRPRTMIGAALFMVLCEGWGKEDGDEWERLMLEAAAQEQAGNYLAAAASYSGAVRMAERPGSSYLQLPLSLNSLANVDVELGNVTEAERLYRRSLGILEKGGDGESPRYAVILRNLGSLYIERGEFARGEALLRKSLAMNARLLAPDDQEVAATRNALAEALTTEGNYGEAERLLEQAQVILEKQPQHRRTLASTLNNLGVIRRIQGRNEEAVQLIERSIELFRSEIGPEHPMLVRGLNNLATAYAGMKRSEEADATFQKALALAQKYVGTKHPTYGAVLLNYAAFLRKIGRKGEAKTLEARSKEVQRDNARRNGLGMTVDASALRHE
jgi:tetratricopeptide (TPR) repeat protein